MTDIQKKTWRVNLEIKVRKEAIEKALKNNENGQN